MRRNYFKQLFSICCCCCCKSQYSETDAADNFMINTFEEGNENFIQDYVLKNAPELSRPKDLVSAGPINRNNLAVPSSKNNSSSVLNDDKSDHQSTPLSSNRLDHGGNSKAITSSASKTSGINNAITTRVMSANKMDDLLKNLNSIEKCEKTESLCSLTNENYESKAHKLTFNTSNVVGCMGPVAALKSSKSDLLGKIKELSELTPAKKWSNQTNSSEFVNVTFMGPRQENADSMVKFDLNSGSNNHAQTPPFNSTAPSNGRQLSHTGESSSCWYERDYSSFSKIEPNFQQRVKPVVKSKPPRKFTCYLILVSLVNALFGMPYIFFDTYFYTDTDITPLFNVDRGLMEFYDFLVGQSFISNFDLIKLIKYLHSTEPSALFMPSNATSFAYNLHINASTLEWIQQEVNRRFMDESCYLTTLLVNAWVRLPLILINIPHALKFYLLFLFYSKFRHRVSVFLRLRFYINNRMLKQMYIQLYENFNRNEDYRRSSRARGPTACAYSKNQNDCRLVYRDECSTVTRKDSEAEKLRFKKTSKGSIGASAGHSSKRDEPSGHFASQEIIFEFKNDGLSKKRPSNKSGELGSLKAGNADQDTQSRKSFKKTFKISNKKFESVFLLHGCFPFGKDTSSKSSTSSQDRDMTAGNSKNSSLVRRVKRLKKFGSKKKAKSPNGNSDDLNNESHVSINSNLTENQILTPKASFKSKTLQCATADANQPGDVELERNSGSPKNNKSLSSRIKRRSIRLLNNSKFLFASPNAEGQSDSAGGQKSSNETADGQENGGSNQQNTSTLVDASMESARRRLKKLSYTDKISKMLVEFESDDDDEPSSIVGFQSYSNSLNELPVVQQSNSICNHQTALRKNPRCSKQSMSIGANANSHKN